jgi:hypothetical protein
MNDRPDLVQNPTHASKERLPFPISAEKNALAMRRVFAYSQRTRRLDRGAIRDRPLFKPR